MTGAVDLSPAARIGGELRRGPDADAAAGAQQAIPVRYLQHDRFDRRVGKAVARGLGAPRRQVDGSAALDRGVHDVQEREVDVERVVDAPGPDPRAACRRRLARAAFEHKLTGLGVVARLVAGDGMQPQGLSTIRLWCAKGHAVRQRLELGSVDVHLELVPCLVVKARLHVDPSDVGVDVHHEHRAVVALKDVQVVEVELAVLTCKRRVEMMRHGALLLRLCLRGLCVARRRAT